MENNKEQVSTKIYLERAIFVNRAPFDNLDRDFHENGISVLSAMNGKGKTTILSHIVDAFHEMAKPHFFNEYEGRGNKFYRVSSAVYNLVVNKPSFVYLRFKVEDQVFDYLDIRNNCTKEEYDNVIILQGKIDFSEFTQKLEQDGCVKMFSKSYNNQSKKLFDSIFKNNLLVYFPAYRYEQPGYLNDPYKIKLDFKKTSGFSGFQVNPIEVVSGLPQLANWIMDVILDLQYPESGVDILLENLGEVVTNSLCSKKYGKVRFGVGPRGFGGTRIQIVKEDGSTVYPTIFNLSSGEASLISLFGELLRHADNNKNNIKLNNITGIVLIDEIDKHLHIKLQKEVLPKLLNLFPNVQFIVSSHSPFLSMGLAEDKELYDRTKIIDLDNLGISKDPTTSDLYREVYEMMVGENDRFKDEYESLKAVIENGNNPLIITEGKTDIKHLKKAKQKLDISDLDVDFYETDEDLGDSKLKVLLEQLSKVPHPRKIVGIYDRDVEKIVSDIEKNDQLFKNYGNNVYAFCIPCPDSRSMYENVSIEFFYSDVDLKTENDGKSLYFDNEINFNSTRKPISKIDIPVECTTKKIWDENIGSLGWIHSKGIFAELVENDDAFTKDFDFNNFKLIFDKIKEIVSSTQDVA